MLRVVFALLFGWAAGRAQPVTQRDAAVQLASRIASMVPRGSKISLVKRNLTAEPLDVELRKAGIEIVDPGAADRRVEVTLSENARGFLLVIDVISSSGHQIAMLPWNPPASSEEKPGASLTKKFLWAQPEPILDVLLLDSSTQMLVLSTTKVASFRLAGDSWTPVASASLVLPRPIPRDPRGRIDPTPDGFRAFIPGATCTGSLQPDLKITCAPGNATWSDGQVRWVTDRNELESDATNGPFYSTAQGLFGGTNGWGSDIAPIDIACAGIIASSATDHENVRAYTAQAVPASEPLALPGPVTALWSAETRGQVSLVVHNAQTGEYEASRLGLACSQ